MQGTEIKGNEMKLVEEGAQANVDVVRHIETMKVGEAVRQGDIYIHCVDENHPHGPELKGEGSRQLAMGETQGSRHIIEGDCAVMEGTTAPEWASRALLGPLVKLFKRGMVTHPEHAHVSLPSGTYQITHQMDARTQQRVRD